MFQRFDFRPQDPNYTLLVSQNATVKPLDFFFHAIPRSGIPSLIATKDTIQTDVHLENKSIIPGEQPSNEPKNVLWVLYGSNTGSAVSFAERILAAAPSKGMQHP